MAEIIGKVSLQAKIAELESRIVALEQGLTGKTVQTTVTYGAKPFGEHWRKMWDEFHLAMKESFNG